MPISTLAGSASNEANSSEVPVTKSSGVSGGTKKYVWYWYSAGGADAEPGEGAKSAGVSGGTNVSLYDGAGAI